MSTAPAPARTSPSAASVAPTTTSGWATPPPAADTPAPAARGDRDTECLVFFVSLVTAAVAMLVIALATDVDALTRLLVTCALTLAAGVITHVLARPVLSGD